MDEDMKRRLTSRDLWLRALYMVFYMIAYGVAELVVTLIVIFQFFVILLTGQANEPVLRLGTNLSRYVYQILQFQTFNSEDKPFPFAPWPDAEPTDSRWVGVSASDPYPMDEATDDDPVDVDADITDVDEDITDVEPQQADDAEPEQPEEPKRS